MLHIVQSTLELSKSACYYIRIMVGGEYGPQMHGAFHDSSEVEEGTTDVELIGPFEQIEPLDDLKEKKVPSLGELNPLLYGPDLFSADTVEGLKFVIQKKIAEHNGRQPTSIDTAYIPQGTQQAPALIARFELSSLTENQVALLEILTRQIYGTKVKTRKNDSGGQVTLSDYPDLEKPSPRKKIAVVSPRLGWYMGPNMEQVGKGHTGLFVFRDVKSAAMARYLKGHSAKEWFFKEDLHDPISGESLDTKFLVEVREANLYQTDLVEFFIQVGNVLGNNQLIPHRELLYSVYNDLNRLGIKPTSLEDIHGLEPQIRQIDRALLTPLGSLKASTGISLPPTSVLMIGVPGTGKTLIAEYFLQSDQGMFIVPMTAEDLANELRSPVEKRLKLKRIEDVFHRSGIPVIIHVDDIENVGEDAARTNTTLMNFMQGVRETGFFVMASTNDPEKLDERLLQAQRFGEVVHFGLQDEEARYHILDIHATEVSHQIQRPLFASADERTAILRAIATHTKNVTPRYLREICTQAKAYYLQRMKWDSGKTVGLTEDDLTAPISIEDWQNAISSVLSTYDKEKVERRDNELRAFAQKHAHTIGFHKTSGGRAVFDLAKEIAKQ